MTTILGIDPGSRVTGYGLIRVEKNTINYIDSGCIRTDSNAALSLRLLQIYNGVCELMDMYSPEEIAIEEVFMYENARSALVLGHARGVAMVAAASHRKVISEYSAREVKQAVVGYGAAEKAQVKSMVVSLLHLNKAPQNDAADALAIAICHSHHRLGIAARSQTRRRKR